jgi:hypothetical protein
MARRVNRDADGIVRNRIPTIRQYDTDARFKGGKSTALYYTISSATTTDFGKKWKDNMRNMHIANTSDTVDLFVKLQIYSSAQATWLTFLNKCLVRVGTALVLTEEDVSIGAHEYFRLITTAASGTPTCQVIIRF